MLKKLWCFIWGHKTVVKAFTGKQFDTYHPLYPNIQVKGNLYDLKRLPYCRRCGKNIK